MTMTARAESSLSSLFRTSALWFDTAAAPARPAAEWANGHRVDWIPALGFDDRFQRLWEFYFCYCEGGFLEQAIGTAQIVLRPQATAMAPADFTPAIEERRAA